METARAGEILQKSAALTEQDLGIRAIQGMYIHLYLVNFQMYLFMFNIKNCSQFYQVASGSEYEMHISSLEISCAHCV